MIQSSRSLYSGTAYNYPLGGKFSGKLPRSLSRSQKSQQQEVVNHRWTSINPRLIYEMVWNAAIFCKQRECYCNSLCTSYCHQAEKNVSDYKAFNLTSLNKRVAKADTAFFSAAGYYCREAVTSIPTAVRSGNDATHMAPDLYQLIQIWKIRVPNGIKSKRFICNYN